MSNRPAAGDRDPLHLSVSEAAAALGMSVPTIKRYIYQGTLKSVKLPGGQHRIAASEIRRLLAPDLAPAETPAAEAERVEVLERWVTELQEEVERLSATIEVLSCYCSRTAGSQVPVDAEHSSDPHRITILGPGCRKCDRLYEMTLEALRGMGRMDVPVEHVRDIEQITHYGPVVTPALLADDTILLSGRVPSLAVLQRTLREALS